MTEPADVLQEASRWIGYREQPDGSNVAPPFTPWWEMQGAWCACWVSFVFWHVGLELGPYNNGHSGGYLWCSDGDEWFSRAEGNAAGLVTAEEAQPGDVLFFEWGSTAGGIDHTGICVENSGYGLTTIEGNVGNRVDVFTRAYWEIPSAGRPRWTPRKDDDEMAGPIKQIAWTPIGSGWADRVGLNPKVPNGLMLYESGIATYIEHPDSIDWMRRLGVPDIGEVPDVVLQTYTYAPERL